MNLCRKVAFLCIRCEMFLFLFFFAYQSAIVISVANRMFAWISTLTVLFGGLSLFIIHKSAICSRMVFVEARQHGRHWEMHFLVNVVCTNWLQMITANYFIIRLQNVKIVSWKNISKRRLLVSLFFSFPLPTFFWYTTLIAHISAQTAKFHEPVTLDFLDAEIEDDIKVQVWKTHFSDSYNCRRSHQNQINCKYRVAKWMAWIQKDSNLAP